MPATTVTLTTSGTRYSILDLVTGASGSAGHTVANANPTCRELILTWDPNNTTAKIYLGDREVSATDFGVQLVSGAPITLRSTLNNISLADLTLVSDTSGAKVDLLWSYA